MQDVKIVQPFESEGDLDERAPNICLFECGSCLLVRHYLLVEVSVVEEFHDDAAWRACYQRELASMKECL